MWTELPLEFIAFCGIGGYLWKTRDRNIEAVAPREEMRRLMTLIGWLLIFAFTLYWGASYFTEQDGYSAPDRHSRHGLHAQPYPGVLPELSDLYHRWMGRLHV